MGEILIGAVVEINDRRWLCLLKAGPAHIYQEILEFPDQNLHAVIADIGQLWLGTRLTIDICQTKTVGQVDSETMKSLTWSEEFCTQLIKLAQEWQVQPISWYHEAMENFIKHGEAMSGI